MVSAAKRRARAHIHSKLAFADQFQQKPTRSRSLTSSYIICTNPRSGSWLLSEGLAATNLAGNPREWFNVLEEQALLSKLAGKMDTNAELTSYLEHVLPAATTSNGVCGVKLHYYQFAELSRKLAKLYPTLNTAKAMAATFDEPTYVWLTRRDKARQAISYFRACRTEQWWHIDGISQRPASACQIEFDAKAIRQLESMLQANDQAWRQYFRQNDIDPLVVDYEDLMDDYVGNVSRVLRWIGIPDVRQIPIPPPRLKRQSDALTEQWLARYISSRQDAGVAPDHRNSPADCLMNPRERSLPSDSNSSLSSSEAPLASPLLEWSDQTRRRVHVQTSASSLTKPERILESLNRLSQLDPRACLIERRSNLSRQEFLESYYIANRPVVIQGALNRWPAKELWTSAYLKERVGDTTVEIMAGREADPEYELNIERHRKLVRFADYIDMVENSCGTNDHYLVANNDFFGRPGCDVLLDDFVPLPDYLDPKLLRGRTFLWFGPAGTVTPLHHDACNILMAQLRGRKRFKVIPALQCQFIYNRRSFFSKVDCEAPDYERWPLFKQATVIDLTLEEGEMLFMPVGWWHQVRTIEASTMVSFTNFKFPNSYDW